MKKAAAEEKIIDGTVNSVVVSGDGTWKTREHTSLIGVCALIGADCGKVLTWKSCPLIAKDVTPIKGQSLDQNIVLFWLNIKFSAEKIIADLLEEWKFAECKKNFFPIRTKKHGLKYQRYIGDGDSKTFLSIAEKPYGDSVPIENRVCGPCPSEWVAACGS
ncbi:uncharacterized protein TNCV_4964951 [Trichonephila clavipes]|nr:uncharacterized protein TNCV_4964951 [Trichonephila clavipes]